ncbi:hypothetical protein BCR34DRAFT_368352 [Clohesyomyces aquaticus]|uniref:Uncharacterized protein n=1 Tax=Clohesyomyces aquaticus TaxID=1231657 RepID=A0A1Y1ZH53_9PLEO|nr:hypothetical protein BCR34DRAFT_368352 [Clohesyomyces aquaticus]
MGLDTNEDYRFIIKRDVCLQLPITFENTESPATVASIPDTGAGENAMTLELATKLGLFLERPDDKLFCTANGTIFQCQGIVKALCGFGVTYEQGPGAIPCVFYVFQKLASPLIMSGKFLRDTETLSKYRSRLLYRARALIPIPVIRTLGKVDQRLLCSLDGQDVEALPDSGSDIDAISYDYARKRGLHIEPDERSVMFADGTIGRTQGVCIAQLAIGFGVQRIDSSAQPPRRTHSAHSTGDYSGNMATDDDTPSDDIPPVAQLNVSHRMGGSRSMIVAEFHILKELTVDVLIGTGSLETLEVYEKHEEFLVERPLTEIEPAPMNRIRLLGGLEQRFREMAQRWLLVSKDANGGRMQNTSFEQCLNEADHRELAHRESVNKRLAKLTGEEARRAEEDERRRREEYEKYRDMLIRARQGRPNG